MQATDLQLSDLDLAFINNFQGNFPLQERPFLSIAERLNCTENELLGTVEKLKSERILTRFGPLYDAAKLGGGLTLAAISVPQEKYEIVTEQVNSFSEVAHNYKREHELNMWFVLATETPDEIAQVISSIEKTTGLTVYNFPKQQEFYIGLWLHLSTDGNHSTIPVPHPEEHPFGNELSNKNYRLDSIDRKLISVTQSGFPIELMPYQKIADKVGITQDEVLQRLKRLLSIGIIRRIGAVPNHYKLGLTANGMTVWDVDDDKVSELGDIIGQLDFVSHCYQRPQHLPMWRYNLFAMVHGTNKDEVYDKVKQIEHLLGDNCKAHETLFSSAILKKTGLRLAA
ncbi:MAG: Lrp/AsnC family transcriptional regulator [Gammaproteobacteria bacterium]|nr:MAG: Lrp/AsnC family transcriptional regulator [Gammaproteobacteria bacterium]